MVLLNFLFSLMLLALLFSYLNYIQVSEIIFSVADYNKLSPTQNPVKQ